MGVKYYGGGDIVRESILLEGATDIRVPSGEDLVIKMGDISGANKVSFVDSAGVEVVSIDSDGAISF